VPKGFDSAREAFAEIEARKNSGGGGTSFFKLPGDGDSAVVRILEDEPLWAWVHDLPNDGAGSYKSDVCLDQDSETGARTGEACPGCDKERQTGQELGWKDRKYRRRMAGVANVIWRDAPKYEEVDGRKNYAKVVGQEDAIAKWTFGKTVLEELDGKATTFKGLTSRDFRITRRGTGLSTSYDIEPVVDDKGDTKATPMSAADRKLAEDAPDLTGFFRKPEYSEWGKVTQNSGNTGSVPPPSVDASPFQRPRTES
jgi:hypothetical protein